MRTDFLTISVAAALLAGTTQSAADDGKCYSLVLSGGGTNGAWEAGIIWGLMNYGDPTEFQWQHVTGVSAGSINTSGLIGFAPEDGVAAAQFMSDAWASATNQDVMQLWNGDSFGIFSTLDSCLWNISCMDDSPALEWLTDKVAVFPDGIKRDFTMSAVNINTGEFESFTQDDLTIEDIPAAALSSSSVPGWFQPREFKGMLLVDGMTAYNTNATGGVQGCLNKGYKEEDIVLDIAICGSSGIQSQEDMVSMDALFNYWRSQEIATAERSGNSIDQTMHAYPRVNYRHLFVEANPKGVPMDFRNQTTWELQTQGRGLALEVLSASEEHDFNGFNLLTEYWNHERQMRKMYGSFTNYYKSALNAVMGE